MTHSKALIRTTFAAMFLAFLVNVTTAIAAGEIVTPNGNRVASTWQYFSSRGIRVRVCGDDQRVGAVNAAVTPATRQYETEASVRIGDNLESVASAYGHRLALMPQTKGTIWFVDDNGSMNRLTFGFTAQGEMAWIALGALRENG